MFGVVSSAAITIPKNKFRDKVYFLTKRSHIRKQPGGWLKENVGRSLRSTGYWLNYNRYAYAYNNPNSYIDPSGEWIQFVIAGAILVGKWIYDGSKANGGETDPRKWDYSQANYSVGWNSTGGITAGTSWNGSSGIYGGYNYQDNSFLFGDNHSHMVNTGIDYGASEKLASVNFKNYLDKVNYLATLKLTLSSGLLESQVKGMAWFRPIEDGTGYKVFGAVGEYSSTTAKLTKLKIASVALSALTVAYDYSYGRYRYNEYGANDIWAVSPLKANINTGATALSFISGPQVGILYFGVDAFYPGGWPAALNDQDSRTIRTQKIVGPTWNPYRGSFGPLN